MCVPCTVKLINISYDPNWNPTLMSQIRACLSLPYYLRQSTGLDVLTKTWTVLCGEQIRTSVEPVSVTMLLSVICSFLLLSVRTTLPVAWYIYRRGSVCLSCKNSITKHFIWSKLKSYIVVKDMGMSFSLILPVAGHSFGRAYQDLNCFVRGTDTYKRRARICKNAPICNL